MILVYQCQLSPLHQTEMPQSCLLNYHHHSIFSIEFQMVQPQNTKKKQSMDTKATDSTAVTSPHTNSSTIDKLKRFRFDHLINLHGDQPKTDLIGVAQDAIISGHLITGESNSATGTLTWSDSHRLTLFDSISVSLDFQHFFFLTKLALAKQSEPELMRMTKMPGVLMAIGY